MAQGKDGKREFDMDDPVVILAILALVGIAIWATWHFLHTEISMAHAWLRYAQFYLFYLVGKALNLDVLAGIVVMVEQHCRPAFVGGMCTRDFAMTPWSEIEAASTLANNINFVFVVIVAIALFVSMDRTHPMLIYKRKHNVLSFMKLNMGLYPHLRVFTPLSMMLIKASLSDPRFGMSLTSRQFALKYRLINGWKSEPDGTFTPSIDRERCEALLRMQLGRPWQQVHALTPAETLLLAIAVPRVAATDGALDDAAFAAAIRDSNAVLGWCWDQFRPPQPQDKSWADRARSFLGTGSDADDDYAWLQPDIDLTYPREVILRYIGTAPVAAVLEQHAYVQTVIYKMFLQARRLGVLAPAHMRWMRFYDRELWYVLQSIGRPSPFAEGCAAHGHFQYEAKAGEALHEPQMEKAITGLELAIQSFRYGRADVDAYAEMLRQDAQAKAMRAASDAEAGEAPLA